LSTIKHKKGGGTRSSEERKDVKCRKLILKKPEEKILLKEILRSTSRTEG